ncbi:MULTISPECIES: AAA family ATPase [unclassified Mesorhizobium]|uniref:AAA family ATPase n=1 Tax=unclassified Mesorhizobium TaxID=325217 RepID=UPI000FCB1D47|nr:MULTISPECIES: AAA family ATPase [unclassified Mesorhizobium]RUW76486.1 pilus assembly protein [Mesorhizobium sp. M4B.F.Ca.ET.049.02.1.2]TGV24669.1 pilus assembly protein [Mesorhizobium sp. M4B.F.Ca.ET.143.01.1.1]
MNAIDTKVLPTRRKQVALFSSDPQFKRDVSTRLDALAIYDVRVSETSEFLKGPPADTRPGIVILDLANGELLGQPGIVEARSKWASVPLIAISDELTSEQTRVLVRMNASDWLHKPLDAKELLNAVTFHDTGNQGTKSRIITFIAASGGAGATTLALSAAEYLASKSSERAASTCLVDLDFQSANCGAYLNQFNQFDLSGIIGQPERLDVELMDVIKLSRPSGLTLYSFERPELPFEPHGADFVLRLLDLVAYRFDDIVIDLPNIETPWHSSVLSTSDEIFIVFELNVASLRQGKRLYKKIRELRGNQVSITLVANKHKRKWFGNHFSRSELEKIFKAPHIKSVALDNALLTDALNRAILPSEVDGRARFNKDLKLMFKERLSDAGR